MTHRVIIGLTGVAGSGKDTAATFLCEELGFRRFAFADAVKQAALLIDPYVPTVTGTMRLTDLVNTVGWDTAKKNPEVRRLLQSIGTEAGWQFHSQDLWTTHLDRFVVDLPENIPVVVTDVRMPHELECLTYWEGHLIEIQRPGEHTATIRDTTLAAHISEAGVGNPDQTIINTTLVNLRYDILVAADQLMGGENSP